MLGVEWFQNVFLQECGPQRPQLLILDSHCSHEPLDLLELAKKENITLLSLPSHCTHYLQPWDRSMFSPLKNKYNIVCSDFMAENMGNNITKQTWPGLFCKAWTSAITSRNMMSGFSSTGIYPFNPEVIPQEAYLTAPEPAAKSPQSSSAMVEEPLQEKTPPLAPNTESPVVLANDKELVYSQANTYTVVADIHIPPQPQSHSGVTLDLPVLVEGEMETVSLPVSFEDLHTDEIPDLGDVTLKEVNTEQLPSEVWNSELDAIFLPEETTVPQVPRKSNASSSRILTSCEIIQAKKEKEELKEQKAKAAEERKVRVAERKKVAEAKRQARLAKGVVKKEK